MQRDDDTLHEGQVSDCQATALLVSSMASLVNPYTLQSDINHRPALRTLTFITCAYILSMTNNITPITLHAPWGL